MAAVLRLLWLAADRSIFATRQARVLPSRLQFAPLAAHEPAPLHCTHRPTALCCVRAPQAAHVPFSRDNCFCRMIHEPSYAPSTRYFWFRWMSFLQEQLFNESAATRR
eukprot:4541970-Prymnesium_polylepis.2